MERRESQKMTTRHEITLILVTVHNYLEKLHKFHPVIALGCRITCIYSFTRKKIPIYDQVRSSSRVKHVPTKVAKSGI
jgi:hypothetical protein